MARELEDWIGTFMHHTRHIPAPPIFRQWGAIAAVASAMGRRVGVEGTGGPIYPNLYVLLVAEGAVGKSQTVRAVRRAVKRLDINLTPNRTTPARMIAWMASDKVPDSSVVVLLGEFSTFLTDNPEAWADLAELYDCNREFTKDIKGRGSKKDDHEENFISKPCVNVLGGVQPDWFQHGIPKGAFHRGFPSRFIFVYSARQRGSGKLFGTREVPDLAELAKLRHDIDMIRALRGRFQPTDDFTAFADEWQEKWLEQEKSANSLYRAYYGRKGFHLVKLAMVHAASRGQAQVLELRDAKAAFGWLEAVEADMPKALVAAGGNPLRQIQESMLDCVRLRKGLVPETELLRLVGREEAPFRVFEALKGLLAEKRIIEEEPGKYGLGDEE